MSTLYKNLRLDWNKHFMLYACLSIIVSTCLGSMAVMGIFQHGNGIFQLIQLFLVVVVCLSVLASILTVQKPKIVLNSLLISLVLTTVIAALNFLL